MILRPRALVVLALPSLVALLLAAPLRAEEATWYSRAVSDGPTGLSFTHFWSKGRSLRALTVIDGRPLVTLVHRDWYYVLDEITGKGIAVQRSQQALREDAEGQRPFGQEAVLIVEEGAEKVRTETVGQTTYDVWRLNDTKARREVWTARDRPDIPLRVEVFDHGTSTERTLQYTDWDWTLDIPERFFRPDARYVIERMSYEEYLRRTADAPAPLPVLYSSLLHGKERIGE